MLLIGLFVLLGIIILCLVGRSVPVIGEGLIFGCVLIASPLIWIEQLLKQWATWGQERYTYTIQKIEHDTDAGVSVETAVFSRLLWLVLALVLLTSDGCNILVASPTIFHVASTLTPPDWLLTASSWSFLIAPLVFGSVITELGMGIALGERLLPVNLSARLRQCCLVYAVGCFLFSLCILCSFAVFRAGYVDPALRKVMGAEMLSLLSALVFSGQVVILLASLALCAHCLVRGGMVLVFGILPGLIGLLCAGVSFLVSLLPRLLTIITLFVSRGTCSPYAQLGAISGDGSNSLQNTRDSSQQLFLPPPTQEAAIAPLPTPEEVPMIGTQQYASLVFGGPFGTAAAPIFLEQLATVAPYARDNVFTHALLDLDHEPQPTRRPGDLSPSATERHTVIARQGKRAYSILFADIGKKQAESHTPYKGTAACFGYVLDCQVIHEAETMLRHVHSHLPDHKLIIVTAFSRRHLRDATVVNNLRLLNTLYQEGIIATTIVIDPTSPFVVSGKHSSTTQLAFAARAIIGLLTAHTYSVGNWANKSSVRLIDELSRSYPLLSLSFASEYVTAGDAPKGWGWLLMFTNKARMGDIAHAQQQAALLTNQVLAEHVTDTQACNEPVNPVHDGLLICHVPLPRDAQFAAFSQEYQRTLADTYSHFSVVTVSGQGTPYPEQPHRDYLLQVSCLYPLGKVLPELDESDDATDALAPISATTQPVLPAPTRHQTTSQEQQEHHMQQDTSIPTPEKKETQETDEPGKLAPSVPVSSDVVSAASFVPLTPETPAAQTTNGHTPASSRRGRPKKQTNQQDSDGKES